MRKLRRIGQIIGSALGRSFCGAFVGSLVGCLSFGLIDTLVMWCCSRPGNAGPFLPDNIKFGFYIGFNTGAMAGALAWFWPGLLRTARRLDFPWHLMMQRTASGAVIGTFIAALNACLILGHASRTNATWSDTRFMNRPLPHHIGPFISIELPLFMMLLGLVIGTFWGTWWGTRKPTLGGVNVIVEKLPEEGPKIEHSETSYRLFRIGVKGTLC